MKKMLSIILVMLFVMLVGVGTAPSAFAGFFGDWFGGGCQNSWECVEGEGVTLNVSGEFVGIDESTSDTGHKGNHNDKSFASSNGFVGFNMDLSAEGTERRWTGERSPSTYDGHAHDYRYRGGHLQKYGFWESPTGIIDERWMPVHQEGWTYLGRNEILGAKIYETRTNADVAGLGFASGDPHAWSYAKDFGRTSKAGAGASFGGEALVTGFAKGTCLEDITGTLWIGGTVFQTNEAGETGYSLNQGINGGNWSEAGGYANKDIFNFDLFGIKTIAIDALFVNDALETSGHTFVTIDPYGSNRSFYGTTKNSAAIDFGRQLNLQSSYVMGGGGVAGMVQNTQGSFVQGQATFSYVGNTQGNGNATIQGSVTPSAVFVSGSAHAVGN